MDKIKTIEIQTEGFFDLIKSRDVSMWTIFTQMIDHEQEQLIIFKDADENVVAEYILPTTVERLEEDKKLFAEYFKEKMGQ